MPHPHLRTWSGNRRRFRLAAQGCVLAALVLAGVARAAAGDLDPSFGSGGKVLTDFGGDASFDAARAVATEGNGGIVVAGETDAGGSPDFALARYKKNGKLDSSFGSGGKVVTDFGNANSDERAFAVAVQGNGKVVAVGWSTVNQTLDFALARYNKNGGLDQSFGSGGKVLTDLGVFTFDAGLAVAIQPDGKIIAAGDSNAGGSDDFALVRYNPDGSIDQSFGTSGVVLTDLGFFSFDQARAVAIQPDGKIVAAGPSQALGPDFALVRYNADGSLDQSFGTGGKVLTDFGTFSVDSAVSIAIQTDGKIVAAGDSDAAGNVDFALARYMANGSLDPGFGNGGKVLTDFGSSGLDSAVAVGIQSDGKIVADGFSSGAGSDDFALARYESDGSLDPTFGSSGTVLTDIGGMSEDQDTAAAIQSDDRIIAVGASNAAGTSFFDFALVRYNGH
jgi:uncharacterized delta-60 repeat protein